ncbi:hypothetical protein SpAn4DRAFT_0276 [Sporomusa ovata]|uniref:Uncharacterized protein n=1 Tax=Sporomusa ovata TaxID=2378 RepID=A0A0U1L4K3_9FIRM|nr:hypothetical protein SpAn4DRAFT_0276 [Sporomusa ovata]
MLWTRRIVAPVFEGSRPSSHPKNIGRSQVGKAMDLKSAKNTGEDIGSN